MNGLNRRHPGLLYKISFLFAFVATFTFLALKAPQDSQAASLANFRPGNIISDYAMSNYATMSVDDINTFLHAHGNCNDTNITKASWYPSLHYHIENGHFICLADERFATSGANYGDLLKEDEASQTAAEIIYEVSQKYKINPQVFLVLLEKEQGLISDSWPNSIQYRSATGFGCPDTAPCDSEYYGLKNQLESAAWLFRTVLDGGWTNYPLGENYIYYNPNRACGGSIVNIENLATSSLYRYTPYQPNQAALNAGYGTVSCGAYGNRNFYLFFMDWFGDPTVEEESVEEIPIPEHQPVPDGTYYITSALGKTLDIQNGGIGNASNVWTYQLNKSAAQEFELLYNPTDGTYKITNPKSSRVLDVSAGSKSDLANVQIYDYNGSCAQKWYIVETNEYYQILSACSNKALDIDKDSANNGANVHIYKRTSGDKGQLWQFNEIPKQPVSDGTYYITSALGTTLDVQGGGTNNASNVWAYTPNQSAAQKFTITYNEVDQTYKITNPKSSRSLDVSGGSKVDGANVQIYDYNGSCAQKWKISEVSEGYYQILSTCSNKALDISGGNRASGANIQIYSSNKSKAQLWKFIEATAEDQENATAQTPQTAEEEPHGSKESQQPVSDGTYYITSALGTTLDVQGGGTNNASNVWAYTPNQSAAQKFTITYNEVDQTYKITNPKSSRSLDVSGGSKVDGANVQIYDYNGSCAQKWKISEVSEGYYQILSTCSNKALDISGGNRASGANIQIYSSNKSKAQLWKFTAE